MINSEPKQNAASICNLKYLSELMGGKKHLIIGIMDAFLKQIPEELLAIKEAITKTNYIVIKSFAHTMKSSVSIMGITILAPILEEMENLAVTTTGLERIKELNEQLILICEKAVAEIDNEKQLYI